MLSATRLPSSLRARRALGVNEITMLCTVFGHIPDHLEDVPAVPGRGTNLGTREPHCEATAMPVELSDQYLADFDRQGKIFYP